MSDEKPNSLWKKEISFRRKPERAAADDGFQQEGSQPVADAPPIWKREITLRKKAKDAPGSQESVADVPRPEPVPDAPPIWKRELTLRKKAKASPVDEEPAAPEVEEPEFAAALSALAFDPEHASVEPEPGPEPALVATPPIEHSWLTQPLEDVSEPPVESPETAEPETLAVVAVEPVVAEFVAAEHVSVDTSDCESDLDLALDLDLDVELASEAELELPPVESAGASVPELPPAILPDVQAAAIAQETVVAQAPEKVPFYKKDLSLKRAPRERGSKEASAPKAAKRTKAKRQRLDPPERADAAEAVGKVPFYKKELSLKRAPKQWDPAEPAAESKSKSKPKTEAAPKPKLRRPARPRPSLPSVSRGSSKTVVGLKIGGSQIAAARIVNGASPELVQAVRAPLEHGIVVGGELRDPDALAVALKEFFARNKLPKRGVRLGIANNRIGVRTFDVSGIDDPKQLANAIRFRAQEVLPIPLEEAVLDYQVLSETLNAEGQLVRRVLLVVAYRELVDRYVFACQQAGLQILGIDLEAFALLRAIAAPHDHVAGSGRGALVAVSVGHDRSTFAVSDGRVCEFTRVLEWGGWTLNVAIARALDSSPSEVEKIKRAISFAGPVHVPEGFSEELLTTAREAAKRQLQTFARELVSSLQFYQNQPGSLSIGEIALTGGTAHLPGLGTELERLIGVPVRIVDPLGRLKVSKRVREQEQVGSLAVAIGLGIED